MARWFKMAGYLWNREDAATMVEYVLVMILIAASCFATVSTFGSAVGSLFQKAVNAFPH